MQAERDTNQQGEGSAPARVEGRNGRSATKWFSYDLPVEPMHPMALIVTYTNENRSPNACDVLIDGKKIGEQVGPRRSPEQEVKFFDVEYPLSPDVIVNKTKITVRFESNNGRPTPAVFGVRIVRTDLPR